MTVVQWLVIYVQCYDILLVSQVSVVLKRLAIFETAYCTTCFVGKNIPSSSVYTEGKIIGSSPLNKTEGTLINCACVRQQIGVMFSVITASNAPRCTEASRWSISLEFFFFMKAKIQYCSEKMGLLNLVLTSLVLIAQ